MESMTEPPHIPLSDALVREILLHREIHFGGLFSLMLEYYKQGGKGVCDTFPIEKIQELAAVEKASGENLAALVFTGADAEQVAKGRKAYERLKEVYEKSGGKATCASKIADLILSEEELPHAEIDALAQEKREIVIPLLLDILQDPEWRNPLAPGYGTAPFLVIQCLEKIGDERAIASLFESIGSGDFFDDEQIFKTLGAIGPAAKQFVLRVLSSQPVREDNHRAAMALASFPEDIEISTTCFQLLQNPSFRSDPSLSPYLLYATESLANSSLKQEWLHFLQQGPLPDFLKPDAELLRKKYV